MKLHYFNQQKNGFTLIELMIATLLGGIVLSACGMLLVGQWRAHSEFLKEEVTMSEIKLLSSVFRNAARSEGNATGAALDYNSAVFTDGSSFTYSSNLQAIIYMNANNASFNMLENSVVSGFYAFSTNNTINMILDITEKELDKDQDGRVNKYTITVKTR